MIKTIIQSLQHLLQPNLCIGCSTDVLPNNSCLCIACYSKLPFTNFAEVQGNSTEKSFYGRVHIQAATSLFYFTKNSLIQNLLFQLKYKNRKEVGVYLGKLLGQSIKASHRFKAIDVIVPTPLNTEKRKQRGYNQAEEIAKGIAKITLNNIDTSSLIRHKNTHTQTHERRTQRWQNMKDAFDVVNAEALVNKNILLVDDVITTGATLEAMAATIKQQVIGCNIYIASVAFTVY